ncbi:MAG: hypothetical protein ACI9XU_001929 [Arenicella sp.]|jgi:hypothetical protein
MSLLLLIICLLILIGLLVVSILSAVFWLIRGVFSLLLFLLKPFKYLMVGILAIAGIAWITTD